MLVETIRFAPQVEQILPCIISLALPLLGITLQQAAKTKARILVNNLKAEELQDLKVQVRDALSDERRALDGEFEFTEEIANKASLARMVQTKIGSASRRREESKPGKPKKRAYMQR